MKAAKNFVAMFWNKIQSKKQSGKVFCYKKMVNFAAKTEGKEAKERAIKNRLISLLTQRYSQKIAEAYKKLKAFEEQRRLAEKKKSNCLNLILRGIARASAQKQRSAYHKLQDNYIRRSDAESLNRTIVENQQFIEAKSKKKLLDKFLKATAAKRAEAFARVSRHNLDIVAKDSTKAKLIKKLVVVQEAKKQLAAQRLKKVSKILTSCYKKMLEKLSQSQSSKQLQVLNSLSRSLKNQKLKEAHQQQLLKRVFGKLLNSSYGNLLEGFRRLRGKNVILTAQQKSVLPAVLDKLVKSRQNAAMKCINLHQIVKAYQMHLTGIYEKEKEECSKRSAKMSNLLARVQSVFDRKKNAAYYKIKETQASNIYQRLMMIMEHRQKTKIRAALDKLICHSLNQRIRLSKLQLIMAKIEKAKDRREQHAISQMKQNIFKQKYTQEYRQSKFKQIMLAKQTRDTLGAYSKLKENCRKRKLLNSVVLRAESTLAYKKLNKHFQKLRHQNLLARNAGKIQILSNMINTINHNHKHSMTSAIRTWASGNIRSKCQSFNSMLEQLFKLRKRQSFDKLLYFSGTLKSDQIKKAVLHLIKKMDEMNQRRVTQAFRIIKGENINPWFKKVINIWSLQSHVDSQIAFWRMRYNKNIQGSRVTPQQAVKLKKMEQILNKHLHRNLMKAFWRIDQGYNTPDDMNVSFAIMSGRGPRPTNLTNRLSQIYQSQQFPN